MPGLQTALQQLAARVARENSKEATLQCAGFDAVPEEYRRDRQGHRHPGRTQCHRARHRTVRPRGSRRESRRQGVVRLAFQDSGEAGYKLIVEDDGQGLSTERIKEAALKKGFITPEQAPHLGHEADLLAAVPARVLHGRNRHQGCGPRRRHESDRRSHATDRRAGVASPRRSGKFTRLTMTLPRAAASARTTPWRRRWIRMPPANLR